MQISIKIKRKIQKTVVINQKSPSGIMACVYLHNCIKRVETPISLGKDTAAQKRAAFAD